MGNIYETVRRLVDWRAEPGARTLSVYMNIALGQAELAVEQVRQECRALLVADDDPRAAALAAIVWPRLATLPRLVDNARLGGYDGLAFFLAAEPPLQAIVPLRFPFENQVLIGRDPFLRQLLAFHEEYERVACAVIGAGSAEICQLHVGDVQPGERVRESGRRSLAGEVNVRLTRMVRVDDAHVVLLGPPALRDAVEAELGADVRRRIIDRLKGPGRSTDPDFARAIHQALQRHERRAEARGVAELLARHQDGDPAAVVGLAESLAAINRGRMRILYVLQGYEQRGWLCDACDALGHLPAPPACLACGASTSAVPLQEHILDQAAACGAEIETVYESEALAGVGGIGALTS